ncbi:MAG: hypothetical protein LBE22_10495 [Azoarcus sp.]|jgi:hypothetical protein|nr:hypothetical protein [Azoarcus sp.]
MVDTYIEEAGHLQMFLDLRGSDTDYLGSVGVLCVTGFSCGIPEEEIAEIILESITKYNNQGADSAIEFLSESEIIIHSKNEDTNKAQKNKQSNMDQKKITDKIEEKTQEEINKYKRSDGLFDWYMVFDIKNTATQKQIREAFIKLRSELSGVTETDNIQKAVRYSLLLAGIKQIGDKEKREKYDRFCRYTYGRAQLLTALETTRQNIEMEKMPDISFINKADTRLKRISLIAFPFFVVATLFRFSKDMGYRWDIDDVSLTTALLIMASVLCLLIAFTRISDWINGDKPPPSPADER